MRGLFTGKKIKAAPSGDDTNHENGLKRVLNAFDLTLMGVGAIVGAGIFATIGTAAVGSSGRLGAGSSLIFSFMITAVVCAFTALCYAELASVVPFSGSAYSYAYATLGELFAWLIGWDLILEYAMSNVAVAISWANYFRTLLACVGLRIPWWLSTDLRTAWQQPELLKTAPQLFGFPIVFNLLALGAVAFLTLLVVWGIKESARVNTVMVLIKIAVLVFFVVVMFWAISPKEMVQNWQPMFPNGWRGTLTGASIVFFSFVGFDSLSTVTEETKNPSVNVPTGILSSLLICTVIYLSVTAVYMGVMPYEVLKTQTASEQAEPLTVALHHVLPNAYWPQFIVAIGAVIAQTTALLVYLVAQPRIFYAMARDGLLPQIFTKLHHKYRTPYVTIWVTSLFIGFVAATASIDEMVDLTNIGTLSAFAVVCIGVPLMRLKYPKQIPPFQVPLGPYIIPALGASSCLALMYYLPATSWWRFLAWSSLGAVIYVLYSYGHSVMGQELGRKRSLNLQRLLLGFALGILSFGLWILPHDYSVVTMSLVFLQQMNFLMLNNYNSPELSAATTQLASYGRLWWATMSIALGIVICFLQSFYYVLKNYLKK